MTSDVGSERRTARDSEGRATARSGTGASRRSWGVVAGVLGCLVGIPAVVLAETEGGLLSAVGLGSGLAFAAIAMLPGFALGLLALVVMLGTR